MNIFKNCSSLKHIDIRSFEWNKIIEDFLLYFPDSLTDVLPQSAEIIINNNFYLHLIKIINITNWTITII